MLMRRSATLWYSIVGREPPRFSVVTILRVCSKQDLIWYGGLAGVCYGVAELLTSPAAPAPTNAADSVKAATLTMAPLPGFARMFLIGTRKLVK